ncbi:MAG: hypothetical protein ACK6DS_10810, partial [Planctomycetota bacterium]
PRWTGLNGLALMDWPQWTGLDGLALISQQQRPGCGDSARSRFLSAARWLDGAGAFRDGRSVVAAMRPENGGSRIGGVGE